MPEADVRARILEAAFATFTESGYSAASTSEIARRARVSKRELYALVGNKQEMLVACIAEGAKGLQAPSDLPVVRDRATFKRVLTVFGARLIREVSDPKIIAAFRLAIGEAVNAPEVADALSSIGGEMARSALRTIMTQALAAGLIDGDPVVRAEEFHALLWGNLMVGLLLGVSARPSQRAMEQRAGNAAEAFMRLVR